MVGPEARRDHGGAAAVSVTEGSILMSIAHCDRRIADADSELERLRGRRAATWQLRGRRAARWQEQDQPLVIRMLRRRLEAIQEREQLVTQLEGFRT
jgi:ribosomal protein L19E